MITNNTVKVTIYVGNDLYFYFFDGKTAKRQHFNERKSPKENFFKAFSTCFM